MTRVYVFFNANNEYQWTVVAHTPVRIDKGKKYYMVGGVQEFATGLYRFKTGEFGYRLDRKNQRMLGDRVALDDLPSQVLKFIEATF